MSLETPPPEQPAESVQELRSHGTNLSTGLVLLGILKSIENELRRRELIAKTGSPPTPLWFLAETERNIFLWRNSRSLDDARLYSFWIDIASLIEKRREQLETPQDHNPFINPLWGTAPLDASLVQNETDYLDDLEDLLPTVFRRAESLSRVSEALRQEMAPEIEREDVVIPLSHRPPGTSD